jgi:aspartate/methionine/tyrosine aminotransferase
MLKIGAGAHAPAFRVMDVIAAANARQAALPLSAPHIIRMEVGQPSTGAPAGAVAAGIAALQSGRALGYTETFGLPTLRERIARHYSDWYGLDIPARRIAVTTGGSGAFPLAFLGAFDRGDRVALAAPYYPPYVNILTALGIVPVILEAGPETRFQPTVAMLEQLDPRPDGLIVASPCNPAGTMLHPEELAAIARWCDQHGVRLISDEIYHGLHYDSALATAAAVSPSAIVVNSFSKYFSMTGWRVGWLVLPEDLARPVECLAQNTAICPPHLSQLVAEAGFTTLSPAEGAFYIYADIQGRSDDSVAFCDRMLRECGVAASPGVDFDPRGGHYVRFSYCGPEADMRTAAERLRKWM